MQPPMRTRVDRLWRGARLLSLAPGAGLGVVEPGAVATRGGRIVFAGREHEALAAFDAGEVIDLEGRLLTPGLIDCHTHLIHAGNRAGEFEQRLAGASYEDIARAGGGILSTVRATRDASVDALVHTALPRLDSLLADGVTTIEIKSGYGLELEAELRMLRAARDLEGFRSVRVVRSFLGAHALPPEFNDRADAFVDDLCIRQIPAVAASGLAQAFDAYCERLAFTPAQVARAFTAARKAGLAVKLHADQLSDTGGAALAAAYGALSADHLEYSDEAGIRAMAHAGTVAVLLPGAYYSLRETQPPPVAVLRRHGVPLAIATDCNPGTSPLYSLLLAMNMAATLFGLRVDEVLAGVTREAACALGLAHEIGTLEAGKHCDLAIWNLEQPSELVYRIGDRPLHGRVFAGVPD